MPGSEIIVADLPNGSCDLAASVNDDFAVLGSCEGGGTVAFEIGSAAVVIGSDDRLLDDSRRLRACQRIGALLPGRCDYKLNQSLVEHWESDDFMDWWGGKIFDTNDDREPDSDADGLRRKFVREFMHKLWFCDSGDFLASYSDGDRHDGEDEEEDRDDGELDEQVPLPSDTNAIGLLDVLVCQHRSNLEMLGRALVDFDVDRVKPCLAGIMK